MKQINLSVHIKGNEKSGEIAEVAYLWAEHSKHVCKWLYILVYAHTIWKAMITFWKQLIMPGKKIKRNKLAIPFQSKPKKQKN
jgi:hypothetical protein